jgi:hypothetical protein
LKDQQDLMSGFVSDVQKITNWWLRCVGAAGKERKDHFSVG